MEKIERFTHDTAKFSLHEKNILRAKSRISTFFYQMGSPNLGFKKLNR